MQFLSFDNVLELFRSAKRCRHELAPLLDVEVAFDVALWDTLMEPGLAKEAEGAARSSVLGGGASFMGRSPIAPGDFRQLSGSPTSGKHGAKAGSREGSKNRGEKDVISKAERASLLEQRMASERLQERVMDRERRIRKCGEAAVLRLRQCNGIGPWKLYLHVASKEVPLKR